MLHRITNLPLVVLVIHKLSFKVVVPYSIRELSVALAATRSQQEILCSIDPLHHLFSSLTVLNVILVVADYVRLASGLLLTLAVLLRCDWTPLPQRNLHYLAEERFRVRNSE